MKKTSKIKTNSRNEEEFENENNLENEDDVRKEDSLEMNTHTPPPLRPSVVLVVYIFTLCSTIFKITIQHSGAISQGLSPSSTYHQLLTLWWLPQKPKQL